MNVLYDAFCTPEGWCSPFLPGATAMEQEFAYLDNDHVNAVGNQYLAPRIACWFEAEGLLS